MAECMSGLAASAGVAGAALGLGAFDYNRENFMGDRDQRKEKEFKTMDMRIEQSKQWREDVEDLISVTEKKMHIYNLTTILLVLVTIFLWCEVEDTLKYTTPEWLFCGFALANTGAFMFLMLSIWFAVYSAVVAQGYNVRLRTQMVRLPIPSWQEIEACRTYGSQFEGVEGRQMFRVPFMMGRQEELAKPSGSGPPSSTTGSGSAGQEQAAPGAASSVASGEDAAGGQASDGIAEFADPWGLERKADNITGLGCPLGAEVANLRHIKMTRQAATLWQSYDGFSRVSLCIGINQLILSVSYYLLAYLVVDVKCRTAGTVAVLTMIVLADCVLKLEIALHDWQLKVAQFFGVLGPVMGLIAAHQVDVGDAEGTATDLSVTIADWFIPIAFLAHGIYLVFMLHLCQVVVQPNGARVPAAFKQKTFLDAFAWAKAKEDVTAPHDSVLPSSSGRGGPVDAPAMDAIKYGEGGTHPFLPQDLAPSAHSDMRLEDGACDPAKRLQVDNDVRVPFYHWGHDGLEDTASGEIVTGHEAEAPGVFPWKVFNSSMMLLALVWILASAWRFEHAAVRKGIFVSTGSVHAARIWNTAASLPAANTTASTPVANPAASVPTANTTSLLAVPGAARLDLPHAGLPDLFKLWASGFLGSFLSGSKLELIQTSWLQASVAPRTLSCDASGRHFVATDGLLTLSAELGHNNVLQFGERHCAALVGESLQDAAVSCKSTHGPCEALVLHRNGRRITACSMRSGEGVEKELGEPKVSTVSQAWLESHNISNVEKVSSMAVKPFCSGGLQQCTYARTTHGRVVQLRQRTHSQELIPTDILKELNQVPSTSHHTVRAFNSRYLGILEPRKQSIDLLDSSDGGLSLGRLLLPPAVRAKSWCAGGGHLFVLAAGDEPQIWRMSLPQALSSETRS